MKNETSDVIRQAEKELSKIRDKYYCAEKNIEPEILITLTDNWINCHIRYIADARNRRPLNDLLYKNILDYIGETEKVKIANSSSEMNITNIPDIKIKK